MLALDCESTSVDVEDARIVSLALVLCGGGQPSEGMDWLVDPQIEIPTGATEVHGITTEHVREMGEHPADALPDILDAVAETLSWGAPLIVQNAPYDLTVLDREARRWGLVPLAQRLRFPVIDPLCADKHLDTYRPGSRKLDAICAHYGYEIGDAHDAGADALAAARAAWCVGARGKVIRKAWNVDMEEERARLYREWEWCREDPWRLHAMQVRWHHAQAASLANHFHDSGQHDAAMTVSLEWPLKRWCPEESAA